MRFAMICVVAMACGSEEEEEEFELEVPLAGGQIHIEETTLDPEVHEFVCLERSYPGGASLLSGFELLARPALQTLEVYLLEEVEEAGPVSCPRVPAKVMGELSEPIRMIYYTESETDDFRFPGGVAVSIDDSQPLLLRYRVKTGAEPEEFEIFLNLLAVSEATVVAPFTFSNESISILPRSNKGITTTCPFNYDQQVVTVAGYQHGHVFDGRQIGAGTGVTVEYDGQELLSGSVGPWTVLEPLAVPREDGLTFTCTFVNSTEETIEHGPGEFEEMCRIHGWVHPADGPLMATAYDVAGQQICEIVQGSD